MEMCNLFNTCNSAVKNATSEFTRHTPMVNQTKFSVLISHPYDEITRTLCPTAVSKTHLYLEASLQATDVTPITESSNSLPED